MDFPFRSISMKSQPQNTEFRNIPENLHPCTTFIFRVTDQYIDVSVEN